MSCSLPPQNPVSTAPPFASTSPSPLVDINRVLASVPAPDSSSLRNYRLGPDDMIRVTLFNVPEGDGAKVVTPRITEARVGPQGAITLPLLSEVAVQGLTVSEVEQKLQTLYDKYIRNPQIGVLVTEYRSQKVAVVGAVQSPGVFELSGPKTVIDLLAKAGGLNANASNQVHLYREGSEGRQSYLIDLLAITQGVGTNIAVLSMPVQAGDIITVPQAGTFFVDGAVGKPGPYSLTHSYTVTQALLTAGGVNRELAKTSAITLFRRHGNAEVETISLDLDEIVSGKAPDPQVGAEDVIVVPVSTPKYIVKRFIGNLIISGFSLDRMLMPY